MRILHVVPSLHPATGGPARSVPALVQAEHEAGMEATLATFHAAGAPWTLETEAAYAVHELRPAWGTRQRPTQQARSTLESLARDHDLVHLHSVWNPAITAAASAARSARRPYMLTPRGMLQRRSMAHRRLAKWLYRRAIDPHTLTRASLIHYFTQAERDDSRPTHPEGVASAVVPNGTPPVHLSFGGRLRFRQRHPRLRDDPFILFAGRLHWSKGLAIQLQALKELLKTWPQVRWVMAGPDGGDGAGLRRLARDLGVASRVVWTGPLSRQELLETYAAASAFVLTSIHEAHSMDMNEALAVGVPIVATRTVRFDEIQEWGAGHVVAWDGQSVASALGQILADPERAAAMRRAGQAAAARELAWPVIARRLERVYESVLAGAA